MCPILYDWTTGNCDCCSFVDTMKLKTKRTIVIILIAMKIIILNGSAKGSYIFLIVDTFQFKRII